MLMVIHEELSADDLWEPLKSELEKRAGDGQCFLQMFPERRKWMSNSIQELREIADDIDQYHRDATIASVAGSSASAVGGILTAAGIIAAPFTSGTSLVLSGVGAGVGIAGSATNLTAGVTETVARSNKQQRVDEILEEYNKGCKEMSACLKEVCGVIKLCCEGLGAEVAWQQSGEGKPECVSAVCRQVTGRETGGLDYKQEQSFALTHSIKQLAALSREIPNASHIKESVRINGLISGSLPLLSRVVSGVLSALSVVLDVFSIMKDSIDLSKGSKTRAAQTVRATAQSMEHELNAYEGIYIFLNKVVKLD
eukprot:gi/632979997/ref/XP_007906783.1/ PREDICTED: apolipoprotein L3-like [Callorhinchus milii]